MHVSLVIAAAGRGSRMGSDRPKALIEFGKETLIEASSQSIAPHVDEIVVVVSPDHKAEFERSLPSIHGRVTRYVTQASPSGTAEAVLVGLSSVSSSRSVIMWGDHIGASQLSIKSLLELCSESQVELFVPIVRRQRPYVYFEFDNSLQPLTFNETRKGAIEIESGWSDCGVFLVNTVAVKDYLENCDLSVEGDTNFLAMFPSMALEGLRFQTVEMYDQNLTLGANTQHELELARSLFHGR